MKNPDEQIEQLHDELHVVKQERDAAREVIERLREVYSLERDYWNSEIPGYVTIIDKKRKARAAQDVLDSINSLDNNPSDVVRCSVSRDSWNCKIAGYLPDEWEDEETVLVFRTQQKKSKT